MASDKNKPSKDGYYVKKNKEKRAIFRVALNSNLLNRLKYIREIAKNDVDVNKTIEKKIYGVVINLEKQYGVSPNDWKNQEYCPECQSPLRLVTGKNGAFIGCSAFPKCTFTKNVNE